MKEKKRNTYVPQTESSLQYICIMTMMSQFFVSHARPTGQVIFSVSIDINYSEQKFAKETFKHRFHTNLCSV